VSDLIIQYITDNAKITSKEALINALWIYGSTSQGEACTTSECQSFLEKTGFMYVTEKALNATENY
jgi:hypothetical protein